MKRYRGKHRVSKHDLREDRFQNAVERIAEAYYRDKQKFWVIGAIVVAVIVGGILLIQNRSRGGVNSEAQIRFTEALGIYSTGQMEQAEQAFADLASRFGRDPTGVRAHYYLGQIYYDAGRYDEARREFATFLKGGASDPVLGPGAVLGIANCDEQTGDLASAAGRYEEVYRTYPDSPVAFLAMMSAGRAFAQAGAYADARRVYDELLDDDLPADKGRQLTRQLSYLEALEKKF